MFKNKKNEYERFSYNTHLLKIIINNKRRVAHAQQLHRLLQKGSKVLQLS